MEKEAVQNAARNPTIPCRSVLGEISSALQNESMAAATTMSRLSSLKQSIYRARLAKKIIRKDTNHQ